MPYISLYRKWRPQRFEDVVGQEHVVRSLTNALRRRQVAHAYLFAGPRGTGKTTLARLLAKGLNCEAGDGPTAQPCNTCTACRQITDGSALDVLEIDGASNRGIDEIRELRDRIRFAPAQMRQKVYIIDEVHMLTPEAFNALLKMLEEPPPHVTFIFATTEAQRVPATILSRCQRFDFERLPARALAAHLQKVCAAEGVAAAPEALALIAREASGGARDALALLEQCLAYQPERLESQTVVRVLGLAPADALGELAASLVEGRAGDGLSLLDRLTEQEGVDPRQLWRELVRYLRGVALLKVAPAAAGQIAALVGEDPATREHMSQLAGGTDLGRLAKAIEGLAGAESAMRWTPEPRLALELQFLRMAAEVTATAPAAAAAPATPAAATTPAASPVRATAPDGGTAAETAAATGATTPSESAAGASGRRAMAPRPISTTPAVTLGVVQARWDELLQSLRRQQRVEAARVEAMLRDARPIGVDGAEVIIGFPPRHDFLRKTVEQPPQRRVVERALSRLFGRTLSLRTARLAPEQTDEGAPEPPADATPAPAELPPPSAAPETLPPVETVPPTPPTSAPPAVPVSPVPEVPLPPGQARRPPPSADTDGLENEAVATFLRVFGARLIRVLESEEGPQSPHGPSLEPGPSPVGESPNVVEGRNHAPTQPV